MKNKNTTLSEHIPKSNIKIVEIGKIDNPKMQIHDNALSWLSMHFNKNKTVGVRLVL